MSLETISKEELMHLANVNKDLEIQSMMTEDVLEFIYSSIERSVTALQEAFTPLLKKELSVSLVDYQLTNGAGFLATRTISKYLVFTCSVVGHEGRHTLILNQHELLNMLKLENETDLTADQLHKFKMGLETGLKQFYKRFTENMNTSILLTDLEKIEIETNEAFEATLNTLQEIKLYEIKTEEGQYHMIHFSDVNFIENTYMNLAHEHAQADEFFFEELVDEKIEVTDTNVAMPTSIPELGTYTDAKQAQFANFEPIQVQKANHNMNLLHDVPLEISVVLGKTKRSIREVLETNVGKIIELDQFADEPLDIYCNGKLIAKGEVVIIEESFGVKVTKLHQSEIHNIQK